jgi:hypothetical protein
VTDAEMLEAADRLLTAALRAAIKLDEQYASGAIEPRNEYDVLVLEKDAINRWLALRSSAGRLLR